MEECDHIIGLDEGFGDPHDVEYEKPELVKQSESHRTIDVKFKHCPMCGVELNE